MSFKHSSTDCMPTAKFDDIQKDYLIETLIFLADAASLKYKIESNSIWKDAFYQSEWVKFNSRWVIFFFSLYVYCC